MATAAMFLRIITTSEITARIIATDMIEAAAFGSGATTANVITASIRATRPVAAIVIRTTVPYQYASLTSITGRSRRLTTRCRRSGEA